MKVFFAHTSSLPGGTKVFVADDEELNGKASTYPLVNTRTVGSDVFAWGYSGTGPTDLTHSILSHLYPNNRDMLDLLFKFRERFVSPFPSVRPFYLTEKEIKEFVKFHVPE
jgi:hypothetical protein